MKNISASQFDERILQKAIKKKKNLTHHGKKEHVCQEKRKRGENVNNA